MPVADGVAEAVAAEMAVVGRVDQPPVGHDGEPPMPRQGDRDQAQRVAVRVEIVGHRVDGQGHPGLDRHLVGHRHRRLVQREHGDPDLAFGLVAREVGQPIAEPVLAGEVRLGRVEQPLLRLEGQGAVLGQGEAQEPQPVVVVIGIVGQGLDQHRLAGQGEDAVRRRPRWAVGRPHLHGDLGYGHAGPVAGRVGEAVEADEAALRGVGDLARRRDRHIARGRLAELDHRQRIGAGCGIVGEHRDRHRPIGRGDGMIGAGDRHGHAVLQQGLKPMCHKS